MTSEIKNVDFSKKKRIVVKVGSSTITHDKTGGIDYVKLDRLVRELCNLKNMGMDVCLVSSGAIAVGRGAIGLNERPKRVAQKQALASIGQVALISIYQKLFSEYNQLAGQVLMHKETMIDNVSRKNAQNTFEELFKMGAIPVVNENDTVSTYEMRFGDNDTLSAIVASLINADALILLSDIDGLYTANPNTDPTAKLIDVVEEVNDDIFAMASGESSSDVGTGGMSTKIKAAQIASISGCDMIITNGAHIGNLHRIFENEQIGTLFLSKKRNDIQILDILEEIVE